MKLTPELLRRAATVIGTVWTDTDGTEPRKQLVEELLEAAEELEKE